MARLVVLVAGKTGVIPVSVTHCYDKIPDKDNRRKEGLTLAYSLRVQSVMVGMPCGQKHEAEGESHSTHSQEAESNECSSFFPFPFSFSSGPHTMEWSCLGLEWEDPPNGPNWIIHHVHPQRFVSMVTLNPIKLPTKMSLHIPILLSS